MPAAALLGATQPADARTAMEMSSPSKDPTSIASPACAREFRSLSSRAAEDSKPGKTRRASFSVFQHHGAGGLLQLRSRR